MEVTALLLAGWTLSQHWTEPVEQLAAGFGVATARVTREAARASFGKYIVRLVVLYRLRSEFQ